MALSDYYSMFPQHGEKDWNGGYTSLEYLQALFALNPACLKQALDDNPGIKENYLPCHDSFALGIGIREKSSPAVKELIRFWASQPTYVTIKVFAKYFQDPNIEHRYPGQEIDEVIARTINREPEKAPVRKKRTKKDADKKCQVIDFAAILAAKKQTDQH